MALQFILGNSGSGKTDYTYKKIVEEAGGNIRRNYLIIVPEQFTMQTQQKLVELAPNHAIMNIDVLSFKRLAYRVFDDLGMSDIPVLEETGKNLVLRKVAEDKKEQLTVLGANMSRMGYIDEVKSLISELVQYNISPEQLEAYSHSKQLSPTFAAKLRDIVTLYRGFQAYMQGNYITAEEILNLLMMVADQSMLLKDAVLIFDEYTGFTPIQYKLLRRIMPMAAQIYVILTMDRSEDPYQTAGEHELFAMTRTTISRLSRMAQELQIEVAEPVLLGDSHRMRFAQAPDLAFLEQNLFRRWYRLCKDEPQHIHMASLLNPREELLWAAREICRLVQEEKYRFRDIAIVTGDVETYAGYTDEILARYRIPYFLDTTTKVVFHPFIESIRAMLQVVEEDFSYESTFRFLRSGFTGIPEEEIDLLDNYIHATGIRGRAAWSRKWLRVPHDKALYDMAVLDELRLRVYSLLAPLAEVFSGRTHTVGQQIQALYQTMTAMDMEQQLWDREAQLQEEGNQAKAKEYSQLYRIVMELLEKYNRLLGQEIMGIEEFAEILDAGLSAAEVSSIPPGYDSVTLGDIERTRLSHVRILFFLGVNDGIIPKAGGRGGIISEFEREMMQAADMELAPGAREQAFIQRFYLYRNLTKPSRHLYISYSRSDAEGKAIRPSYLIGTIARLFPQLTVQETESLRTVPNLSGSGAALDYLVYGKQDETWYALAGYFLAHRDTACLPDQMQELIEARYLRYQAEPLSRHIANRLYGNTLSGNVTRLEQFASCAYAHFLRYGLSLKEREENGFENVDMGNLYHDALALYSRRLAASPYNWFIIPDEVRDQMARTALGDALQAYPNLSTYATAGSQHQTVRMEDIFCQTVWALTRQVRAGRFEPREFEVSFAEMSDAKDLHITLDREHLMQLSGRIDRLDLCREDGRVMVKVIDYKSGSEDFELIRVYKGLTLQLMVYMNTAMDYMKQKHKSAESLPAAVLYYNIDDPVLKVAGEEELTEEEIRDRMLAELRPKGMVNSEEAVYRALDQDFDKKSNVIPLTLKKDGSISSVGSKVASTEEFAIISEYVHNQLRTAGQRIYEGDISVSPYKTSRKDSCVYCPYSGICGINSRVPGYSARGIEDMKRDEIIAAMEISNAAERSRQG